MPSTFQKGDIVSLIADNPILGLKAGDLGVIWLVYDLMPDIYEVTFGEGKDAFDMATYEEEIQAVAPAALVDETPFSNKR